MTAITDRPAPPYLRELVLRRAEKRGLELREQRQHALALLGRIDEQISENRAEWVGTLMDAHLPPEGIAYLSGGPMTITDVRVLARVVARWETPTPDPITWDALEGRR